MSTGTKMDQTARVCFKPLSTVTPELMPPTVLLISITTLPTPDWNIVCVQ